MRLSAIILRNFRPYAGSHRIPVDALTAFVGKNDIGKSCILEALNIFFNNAALDLDDFCKLAGADGEQIAIGCAFTDLPSEVILDAHSTTLIQPRRWNPNT
jgi:putative ATP-dependent endonuclease of the OLD family